jgi:hypothetical protein
VKMPKELYNQLVKALREVKQKFPNMTPQHYIDNKIGKDHAMRHRWDMLYCTSWDDGYGAQWLVKHVYPLGMNDTHVDTALRAAVKEVWG